MSDEPRAGEWATVIEQHCSGAGVVGNVVFVDEIEPPHPSFGLRCHACHRLYALDMPHALLAERDCYHPLAWLKRLPPPGDVEKFDLQQEITDRVTA